MECCRHKCVHVRFISAILSYVDQATVSKQMYCLGIYHRKQCFRVIKYSFNWHVEDRVVKQRSYKLVASFRPIFSNKCCTHSRPELYSMSQTASHTLVISSLNIHRLLKLFHTFTGTSSVRLAIKLSLKILSHFQACRYATS